MLGVSSVHNAKQMELMPNKDHQISVRLVTAVGLIAQLPYTMSRDSSNIGICFGWLWRV
jgi:hypothetical protein